jgi:hypothetical protein
MLSAQCLLLGTVRARNSRIAVLRRQDRGDLFISSRSRSVRCHRRWLPYGRLHTRGGTNAVSVARSPIVHLLIRLLFAVPAARVGYDVTFALAHFGIPQEWNGGGSRRRAWRHRRRVHRLGTRVGLDRARSEAGRCVRPSPAADWGDDQGQLTLRVYRLSVGISADIGSSNMTATSRSTPTLRLTPGISSADYDPVARSVLGGPVCAATRGHPFLHAWLSFPSPGMRGFLCGPITSCHVSKMLFSAREHLASHWLDLAEGGYASIA